MQTSGDPAYWNQVAHSKQFGHPLDHAQFAAQVPRHARILDYGCGHGRLSAELLQLGYDHVLGVDSSTEMVRLASERQLAAKFALTDGTRLPCAAASLDAILVFAVLTAIPADDAQKNLLREFKRALRPGGLLLISDYPLQQDERNRLRYEKFAAEFGVHGIFRLPDGGVMRHHRHEWFAELLRDFDVYQQVSLDVRTMNGNAAKIAQFWARNRGNE